MHQEYVLLNKKQVILTNYLTTLQMKERNQFFHPHQRLHFLVFEQKRSREFTNNK